MELIKLGVSKAGIEELLSFHELDEVERQLTYLPFRNAKRPEALIMEAVRKRYSPPKEFYYASPHPHPSGPPRSVDEDAQPPA
jgi:hypothetical protein